MNRELRITNQDTTTARVDLLPVVLPHLLSAIEDDGARAGERRAAWVRELALGEPARRS